MAQPSTVSLGSGPRIVRHEHGPVFINLQQVRRDIAMREAATWLANLARMDLGAMPKGRDYLLWDDLSEQEQDFYAAQVEQTMQSIWSAGADQKGAQ